jgi:hypothetical protein
MPSMPKVLLQTMEYPKGLRVLKNKITFGPCRLKNHTVNIYTLFFFFFKEKKKSYLIPKFSSDLNLVIEFFLF